MSILSDAWRRAKGEEDAVTRVLGAPPAQSAGRRGHWLPWLLCCLLLIVLVGMGVYLWRSRLLPHPRPQSAASAAVGKPAKAMAEPARAHKNLSGDTGTGHAGAARVSPKAHALNASTPRSTAPAALAVHTGSVAAAAPLSVPDAVRAQLPPLAVTVHVWNPRPAARFVVVGGRIYHEGDEIQPGLRLVRITRNGEVVNFRGYRITLNGH